MWYSEYVTTLLHTSGIDDLYKAIGQQVRAKRVKHKLTQGQLAARVGLQRTSLSNIEAGRQKMLVDTLVSIAAELGVKASSLLPQCDVQTTGSLTLSVPDHLDEDEARFLSGVQGVRKGVVRKGTGK